MAFDLRAYMHDNAAVTRSLVFRDKCTARRDGAELRLFRALNYLRTMTRSRAERRDGALFRFGIRGPAKFNLQRDLPKFNNSFYKSNTHTHMYTLAWRLYRSLREICGIQKESLISQIMFRGCPPHFSRCRTKRGGEEEDKREMEGKRGKKERDRKRERDRASSLT